MPIDPNIVLGLMQPRVTPTERLDRQLAFSDNIQMRRDAAALRQENLRQKSFEQDQKEALFNAKEIYARAREKNPNLKPKELYSMLGPYAEPFIKQMNDEAAAALDQREKQAAIASTDLDRHIKFLDQFGGLLNGLTTLKTTEERRSSLEKAVQSWMQAGLIDEEQGNELMSDDLTDSGIAEAIAANPAALKMQLEQARQAADLALRQATEARAAKAAEEAARHNRILETQAATTAERLENQAAEMARHNRTMEARPVGIGSVVVQTPDGPQLVNKQTGTASPILSGNEALPPMPTSDQRNRLAALRNIDPVLTSIAGLSEKINTGTGLIAKASGAVEKAKAQANYNDDVAEYEALISGFTPMVARAVGHTGVLTEQDVQSVKALFPKPGDSKSLRDRKIAQLKNILGAVQQIQSGTAPEAPTAGADPLGLFK